MKIDVNTLGSRSQLLYAAGLGMTLLVLALGFFLIKRLDKKYKLEDEEIRNLILFSAFGMFIAYAMIHPFGNHLIEINSHEMTLRTNMNFGLPSVILFGSYSILISIVSLMGVNALGNSLIQKHNLGSPLVYTSLSLLVFLSLIILSVKSVPGIMPLL